jgi:acetyl-CoA carboxylase biotin carboxyl carrier protein
MAKKKKASASSSSSSPLNIQAKGPMDPALIERLVSLMAAADLSELDVSDGSQRIALKRGSTMVAAPVAYAPATPPATKVAAPVATPTPTPTPTDDSKLIAIKSPMVGTFYSRPTPDAKPFVQIGTQVNEDSDVCIIEAMKVFNNIKAEVSGKIEKIMAENGQVVEFGQVLFYVKGG